MTSINQETASTSTATGVPAFDASETASSAPPNLDESRMITLVSSDGRSFKIPYLAAIKSIVVKNFLDDFADVVTDDFEIPLVGIDGRILEYIIKYLMYHRYDTEVFDQSTWRSYFQPNTTLQRGIVRTSDITQWDRDYITSYTYADMFAIFKGSNYLEIDFLTELCCKTVANLIKNSSVQELQEKLGITEKFSEQELREMYCEDNWIPCP